MLQLQILDVVRKQRIAFLDLHAGLHVALQDAHVALRVHLDDVLRLDDAAIQRAAADVAHAGDVRHALHVCRADARVNLVAQIEIIERAAAESQQQYDHDDPDPTFAFLFHTCTPYRMSVFRSFFYNTTLGCVSLHTSAKFTIADKKRPIVSIDRS